VTVSQVDVIVAVTVAVVVAVIVAVIVVVTVGLHLYFRVVGRERKGGCSLLPVGARESGSWSFLQVGA
jgi:hypothetical protein